MFFFFPELGFHPAHILDSVFWGIVQIGAPLPLRLHLLGESREMQKYNRCSAEFITCAPGLFILVADVVLFMGFLELERCIDGVIRFHLCVARAAEVWKELMIYLPNVRS